ncbi:MAG: hypothetical protein B6I28_01185 [Fusobacteriia bacterium 4572_132]|nr:MAG: hypothetical protein B6I28_01185 [Fusobacteriia bacterium 4572_132]
MKKIKVLLMTMLMLSALSFASFNDIPEDHWASQAVKNLYKKGLLAPTMDNVEKFNGEGVFSKYEVAEMLYYNLKYFNEKIENKASAEDIIALKALTENFAPEIAKLGVKAEDVEKRIADIEKTVNKKILKKIEGLDTKVGKVNISGEFVASQTIGMKENSPGMEDLDSTGTITIVGKTSKNVTSKVTLGIEEGEDVSVDGLELKAKSKNLTLTVFKDSEKEVANYEDTLALFDGSIVKPEEGVLLNGNYKIMGNSNRFVGMFYKTKSGDIYGLQTKQQFDVLRKSGINAFLRGSYVELIKEYQFDIDEFGNSLADSEDAKALYSVDGELRIKPLKNISLAIAGEYATRRSPKIEDFQPDTVEYLPGVTARDAMYLYTNAKISGLGIYGSAGLYNSGEFFDIKGIGNDVMPVFGETSLIQVGSDKKAFMGKIGWNLFDKGIIDFNAIYASYGSNRVDALPAERIEMNVELNPLKVLKLEGYFKLDKEEVEVADAEYQDKIDGTLEAEDGMRLMSATATLDLFKNSSQKAILSIQDDLDKEDKEDTDKWLKVEMENEMQVKENIIWNTGMSYKDNGLGLENYYEYKIGGLDGNTWVQSPKNKEFEKYTEIELGTAFEIETKKYGVFNTGVKYFSHDEKGGIYDETANGDYPEGAGRFEKPEVDSSNEKDKQNLGIFASHTITLGNLSIVYGYKYLIEKEGCEYKDYSVENKEEYIDSKGVKYWELRDKSKAEGGEYTNLYGIGLEYDFGNDVVAGFKYGDPTITRSDESILIDRTSFADGEQDQFTFEVTAKF